MKISSKFSALLRLTVICLVLSISITGCKNPQNTSHIERDEIMGISHSFNGIWVSYIDLKRMCAGGDEKNFLNEVNVLIEMCKQWGWNQIVVQVRPFGDAIYPSEIYPWSHIITGTQGKNPGFDPLRILINAAHENNIGIHCWVNPYRLSSTPDFSFSENNSFYLKMKDYIYKNDTGVYLVPSDEYVNETILEGIKELVRLYPEIDGVHMDDYFYPSSDPILDEKQYKKYISDGGTLDLAGFRRQCVSNMIASIYTYVHSTSSTMVFGVSPQGNMGNNYNSQFADVSLWMERAGFVDYICPQIYWGFQHQKAPFENKVMEWSALPRDPSVALYVGLTASKIGGADQSAGDAGINEWVENSDRLSKMAEVCHKNQFSGLILFRYDLIKYPRDEVKQAVEHEMTLLSQQLGSWV